MRLSPQNWNVPGRRHNLGKKLKIGNPETWSTDPITYYTTRVVRVGLSLKNFDFLKFENLFSNFFCVSTCFLNFYLVKNIFIL